MASNDHDIFLLSSLFCFHIVSASYVAKVVKYINIFNIFSPSLRCKARFLRYTQMQYTFLAKQDKLSSCRHISCYRGIFAEYRGTNDIHKIESLYIHTHRIMPACGPLRIIQNENESAQRQQSGAGQIKVRRERHR